MRAARPLAVLMASACLVACGPGAPEAPPPPPPKAAVPAAPVPAAIGGPSIYDLDLALTDHAGRALKLDAGRGHPVVISMFYATCPAACPLLISDIKRLEQALDERTRAETRMLLVSLDPARDTVEAMAKLAEERELDPARWTLARIPEGDVRMLAAVLGIQYRFMPDGNINHSSVITVLGPDGVVAHRTEGLQRDVEPAAAVLRGLVLES